MTITPQIIKEFDADMAAAMAPVYEKHGMIATSGAFIPSGDGFHFKLNVGSKNTLTTSSGFVANPVLFKGCKNHGDKFNVTIENLGRHFLTGGSEYVFLGVNQTGHFAVGQAVRNGKETKLKAPELQAAIWLN